MSKKLLIEIFIGFVLSWWIIKTFFSGETKFENLALGTETVSYQAVDENKKLIHISKIDGAERSEFIENWEKRGKKKVILFMGNSQMHSINQMKAEEVNFLEQLYFRNRNDSTEILGNSLPNAGLQEFLLAYEYWKEVLPLKAVVIPLFMDDLREDGIRNVFFEDLVMTKFQIKDSGDMMIEKINADLRSYWSANPNNKTAEINADMAALDETFQEKTETYLNDKLNQTSEAWRNRQNVRGEFFNWIYKLRNTVFGINANTIRRMIPQRLEANMNALNLIIDDCIKNNRQVILYIPPIRSDVVLPYDLNDYSAFKARVEKLASSHGDLVVFKNYESIIPGELWGYKAATNLKAEKEIDFMHFQYKGHQILTDSLQVMLKKNRLAK
ncbi:MAG: hypothetical protein HOP08_16905 [Cyclobacteriaceae bacterium]|nr:hypothetical protein [Cyclobacteriaceae bacterium]